MTLLSPSGSTRRRYGQAVARVPGQQPRAAFTGNSRSRDRGSAGPLSVRHRQQSGRGDLCGRAGVAFDTTVIYALGGLMTGLAGMMEASRPTTGSFPPQRIQVHHDHAGAGRRTGRRDTARASQALQPGREVTAQSVELGISRPRQPRGERIRPLSRLKIKQVYSSPIIVKCQNGMVGHGHQEPPPASRIVYQRNSTSL